jgi:hypothetical protein
MYKINNEEFEVLFDEQTGNVVGIYNMEDVHHMNWADGDVQWGTPALFPLAQQLPDGDEVRKCLFETKSVSYAENILTVVYEKANIKITAVRQLEEKGYYTETYTITNTDATELFLEKGRLGIFTTFNDNYQDAETCLTYRCHTHLWCNGNTSYINAVRMSSVPPHLGLTITEGSLDGYSVVRNTRNSSNDRGDFILNPSSEILEANGSFQIGWKMFFYEKDFFSELSKIKDTLYGQADKYTLFPGEEINIEAYYTGCMASSEAKRNDQPGCIQAVSVTIDDKEIPYLIHGNKIIVKAIPESEGEKIISITVNNKNTKLRILVVDAFDKILQNRAEFIAHKQQYHKAGSHLDGAYLIYDKETKGIYYDSSSDHNSGRERVVMGVIIACYLQKHKDDALKESLMKYISFIRRELFDKDTGVVYNNAPRDNSWHRNYNYPWMASLWIEMFHLTGDTSYLKDMYCCMMAYYKNNGKNFYAIGIAMKETIDLLIGNDFEKEAEELLQQFIDHGEVILKNSSNYPAHEVKYEQSIVAPAVSYLCQLYQLTEDKRYFDEAENQLLILSAFGFKQPDYHLNEISIRHWDGYWFGKRRLYGDTFPHYWSVLSGDVFARYAQITGDKGFKHKAEQVFRNNLCLFEKDGFGSCAYLYPNNINGIKGAFYDPWANDQDWALYYAYKWMKSFIKML